MTELTHGSLFSGIGGFDYAAQMAGITTIWNCEKDKFCQKVLKKHFAESHTYTDIYELKNPPPVSIISGGFPCQPFSVAGKRKGNKDERYLWLEMLRVINEVKPSWVIGENVPGLANMAEFENICISLENSGYEVQTFNLPACAVGLPHKRNRIWIVANTNFKPIKRISIQQDETKRQPSPQFSLISQTVRNGFNLPAPALSGGNDGVSNRLDRIRALGNAIVPQIAYVFFELIKQIESE